MPAWFDTFAEAIGSGDQRYLACEACGEAMLPPRRICPACGSTELRQEPLSGRGEILSFSEISITIPKFHGETPYTSVLVAFDEGVSLTGQLRDATAAEIAIGDEVDVGVEPRDDGPAVITFRPAAD